MESQFLFSILLALNFNMQRLNTHIIPLSPGSFLKRPVDLLVDDNLGSPLQGNKWRKLNKTLELFPSSGKKGLLSFGGAFSNHALAISYAGFLHQFPIHLIIRGEEAPNLSPTLRDCRDWGAQLQFVTRSAYAAYRDMDYESLCQLFPDYFVVPEGGDFALGEEGFDDFSEFAGNYTHIALALGTGTTARGIRKIVPPTVKLILYPVLKGLHNPFISDQSMLWHDHAHLGGYAKQNEYLLPFATDFYKNYALALDPVYTAKAMMALYADIHSDFFAESDRILFYHTGGLQGIRGYPEWDKAFKDLGFSAFSGL